MLPCDVLMGLKVMQNVLLIAPNTQLGVIFKVGAAELMLIYSSLSMVKMQRKTERAAKVEITKL